MGISRMRKVLLAGHMSEYAGFITELQHASILHIEDISQEQGDLSDQPRKIKGKDVQSELSLIEKFLGAYRKDKSLLEDFTNSPVEIKNSDYKDLLRRYDAEEITRKSRSVKDQLEQIRDEQKHLEYENNNIQKWKNLPVMIGDLGQSRHAAVYAGIIRNSRLEEVLGFGNAEVQVFAHDSARSMLVVAVHQSENTELLRLLENTGFEFFDLFSEDIKGDMLLIKLYNDNLSRLHEIKSRRMLLEKEAVELSEDFDRFRVIMEYHDNDERKHRAAELCLNLKNSFILEGWIREKDEKKLKSVLSVFDTVEYRISEKKEGEIPPVAFENKIIFAPFQLLTRLYSNPSYSSIDPSPVLAVFFGLFFGITLTDAGYGLILTAAGIWGLRKFKRKREIAWILLWGGVFSIIAGLLTGGIFGNLFRAKDAFVSVPLISQFRESLMWFDPMSDPMIFFRLVLFLGLVHITTGIILGLITNLRQRKWLDAFVDNAAWIVIIFSLGTLFFSSELSIKMSIVTAKQPYLGHFVRTPASVLLVIMASVIILFSARDEESFFFRIFIGFLRLVVLNGIFSYLGDLLSYIRLMALGMVTAGIGMAINTIAFMMYSIPFAGIILAVIVLIGGHAFNMAINMLGGFVHTLRLQYVEFFSKFFISGGREFVPFSNAGRYIKVID